MSLDRLAPVGTVYCSVYMATRSLDLLLFFRGCVCYPSGLIRSAVGVPSSAEMIWMRVDHDQNRRDQNNWIE